MLREATELEEERIDEEDARAWVPVMDGSGTT